MSLEKVDALEERITKVVELVKALKDEKNRLSVEVERLQAVEEEAGRLRQERDQVRDRLENIITGIETITT